MTTPKESIPDKLDILNRIRSHELNPEQGLNLIKQLYGRGNEEGATGEKTGAELLFFQEYWEEMKLDANKQEIASSQSLLVFTGDEKVVSRFARQLTHTTVIGVKPGKNFREKGQHRYEINPGEPVHYLRLLEALKGKKLQPGQVIHTWSQDNPSHWRKDLNNFLERSIYSVFYLTQALMGQELERQIRLLYVYPGADDAPQPLYAAVSGLVRTIRLENPRFLYKTIEMSDFSANLGELPGELEAGEEPEVRYQGSTRLVKRFKESIFEPTPGAPLPLKQNGTYLITGGAGGLGLICAGYLAEQVKARLILTGRSPLNAEKNEAIKKLESKGARVIYLQSDVSKRKDVETLAAHIKSQFRELNGIIHCAGVTRDAFILKKNRLEIEAVLAPKIPGTVHLDDVFQGEKPDFFILYSSLAGVMGNVGQGDYAYANRFMDYFAHWREKLRLRQERTGKTISINWPLWQEGGMGGTAEMKSELARQIGSIQLPTTEGITALEYILKAQISHCQVAYGIPGKLREIFHQAQGLSKAPTGKEIKPTTRQIDPAVIYKKTQHFLKGIFTEVLKLPENRIDPTVRFQEYGIDSIMINIFNARIEQELGWMSKTLLFEYKTLQELTDYFVHHHEAELVKLFQLDTGAPAGMTPPGTSSSIKSQPVDINHLRKKYLSRLSNSVFIPHGDIAIIGINGRYPLAGNLTEFWHNLKTGRDCITEIPAGRWDYRDYYDPDPEKGKMYCKWGGFLDDVDRFDPLFFNISPREAERMDPQERVFLEAVWSVLEDAGYTRQQLTKTDAGNISTDVGVFAGVTTYTYQLLGRERAGAALSNAWTIANRVSFALDFHGPSMPVDTACSASLTAIHLACESLKRGECQLAVAGGVNLYLHPSRYLELCSAKMLSLTGRCHTFGEAADGFVPGEGVGVVLLKPLKNAERDKDYIYAVIKGSSINHGGRTNGYTVPNPAAHSSLILQALKNSAVDPRTISYIEAHGTGTSLGDPIEIEGLTRAFREYTQEKRYCAIGSVKSNIGHLESAAGIAGISKIILQMMHKQLTPSLHAERLNPNIDFDRTPFYVQRELALWEQPVIRTGSGESQTYPRRAGISSFGAGGSNVHVVLEDYENPVLTSKENGRAPYLLVLSARDETRLKEYARKMADFLESPGGLTPGEDTAEAIAYTLQLGRESLPERIACIASNLAEYREQLSQYCREEDPDLENVYRGNTRTDKTGKEELFKGKAGDEFIKTLVTERDLARLAQLWVSGVDVDWSELYPGRSPYRVPLPTYPFARQRCWVQPEEIPAAHNEEKPRLHPLLDSIDPLLSLEPGLTFRKTLKKDDPLVRDHRVMGQCILPGVAYLELMSAAFSRVLAGVNFTLHGVLLLQPLAVLEETQDIFIHLKKDKNPPGQFHFEIRTRQGTSIILHARGALREEVQGTAKNIQQVSLEEINSRCSRQMDGEAFYAACQEIGIRYGSYFRGLKQIVMNDEEALGVLCIPREAETELGRYRFHPAVMDTALQTIAGIIRQRVEIHHRPLLPFSFEQVEILHPMKKPAYAYAKAAGPELYHVAVLDEEGRVGIKIQGVTLRKLKEAEVKPAKDMMENFFYKPRWIPAPIPGRQADLDLPGSAENPGSQEKGKKKILLFYSSTCHGLEKALAAEHASDTVMFVQLGEQTQPLLPQHQEIAVKDPDALDRLVGGLEKPDLIYFLGGIDAREPGSHESWNPDNLDYLDYCQEKGVLSLFRLIKALIKHKFTRYPLGIKVITNDIFRVFPGETIQPYFASLVGLTGSLAREYSRWAVSFLDIGLKNLTGKNTQEKLAGLARAIRIEPANPRGEPIVLREGRRYTRKLEPVLLPPAEPLFKPGGVYVILGGTGGIGLVLSSYLAEKYQARLVLLARSALTSRQEEKISSIQRKGGQVLFLRADASDPASMKEAIKQVKSRFGSINGVVHSALVLKDRILENMDEETFRAALAPKVAGSVTLYQVLKQEPLDFMLFFSSAQSFSCNAGQSNYAAACTFKDAFALYLEQEASFPVHIINWGYWGSVGVVASPEYNRQLSRQGVKSIEPEEGLEAVRRVLAHRLDQVMVLKAEDHVLAGQGIHLQHRLVLYPPVIPSVIAALAEQTAAGREDKRCPGLQEDPTPLKKFLEALEELRKLSRLLLLRFFRQHGLLLKPGEQYRQEESRERLGILPAYSPLYDALLDILANSQWIQRDGETITTQPKLEDKALVKAVQDLERRKEKLLKKNPGIAAFARLVFACVQAYPDILTGGKSHLESMFPGGSMELVEPIYKGNQLSDFYNDLAARIIENYVRLRIEKDPQAVVQILEVGAGTGGTTAYVLAAIDALKDRIRYFYTDISHKFLQHGRKEYASRYPFVEFKLLDLEKNPTEQGFVPGSIDILLGANVFHATREIQHTLNQVKILLKANGLLLISEVTRIDDLNTLTFGLTEGWWCFEDKENRLKGSPLLNLLSWQQALETCGYHKIFIPQLDHLRAEAPGQHILLAESNGEVSMPVNRPLTVREKEKTTGPTPVPTVKPSDKHTLSASVEEMIIGILSRVLHVDKSSIDPESSFQEYGVDSLLAVEIIEKLNEKLDKYLRATELFNFSTIRALSNHIVKTQGYKNEPGQGQPDDQEQTTSGTWPVEIDTNRPVTSLRYEDDRVFTQTDVMTGDQSREIAVIGMSGRFPGARDVNEYWQNLAAGKNSIREVPPGRWSTRETGTDQEDYRWGGFLDDIDGFDAQFFHMSPPETQATDPQHRLFLEEAWHALEDAGYAEEALQDLKCGVFVGCTGGDYNIRLRETGLEDSTYSLVGNAAAVIPARISYFLNLKGPAIAIDTACSSSLISLHLACESIRSGDCHLAVAGGVMITTTPIFHRLAALSGMLSAAGQCKSFDDTGDGFVPGEGVGVVVLKSLTAAMQDRDHIYAVIKGSAINHDGRTMGITAPSAPSQASLECEAYDKFNIDPGTLSYIETHGTATKLGDSIEIHALTDVFSKYTQQKQFCAIGSVKTNIGHLFAAAGIAGLIKVILSMQYKKIPPSLHYKTPNRYIDFATTPFYVNTGLQDWHPVNKPRRAAVSAFGFSGSNAHVVAEEAPPLSFPSNQVPAPYYLIPLSARSSQALEQEYADLLGWYESGIEDSIENIAYTLAVGRNHFAFRSALIVKNSEELRKKLGHLCTKKTVENYFRSREPGERSSPGNPAQEQARLLVEEIQANPSLPGNIYKEKLTALAAFYIQGVRLDWALLYRGKGYRRISLPTYPFTHTPWWLTAASQPELSRQDRELEDLLNKLEKGEITVHEANRVMEAKI